jgi:hypothetical protein
VGVVKEGKQIIGRKKLRVVQHAKKEVPNIKQNIADPDF